MVKLYFLPVTVGDLLKRQLIGPLELSNMEKLEGLLSRNDFRKVVYLNSSLVRNHPDTVKYMNCLGIEYLYDYLGLNILDADVENIQQSFLASLMKTGEEDMHDQLAEHLHRFKLPFEVHRISSKEYGLVFSEMEEICTRDRALYTIKSMETILKVVDRDIPSQQLLKEPLYQNYLEANR